MGRIAPPGQEGWREAPGWLLKEFGCEIELPSCGGAAIGSVVGEIHAKAKSAVGHPSYPGGAIANFSIIL
jgi:hypothetical protein